MIQDPHRLQWLDLLKGVAIFLVVLGHMSYNGNNIILKEAIYSFHMPLFFMLAGCSSALSMQSSKAIGSFIRKRLYSPFLPYVIWCLIYGIAFCSNVEAYTQYSLAQHIHSLLCGDVMVWFLIALFTLQMLFAIYAKLTAGGQASAFRKLATAFLLFSLLFVCHRMWGKTSPDCPYWTLEFLTNAYCFFIPFCLGIALIQYKAFYRWVTTSHICSTVSIAICLFYTGICSDAPIVNSNYSKIITGAAASFLFIRIAMQLASADPSASFSIKRSFVKMFSEIGKSTLAIYLISGAFIARIDVSLTNGVTTLVVYGFFALVTCLLCIAIEKIILLSPVTALLLMGRVPIKRK